MRVLIPFRVVSVLSIPGVYFVASVEVQWPDGRAAGPRERIRPELRPQPTATPNPGAARRGFRVRTEGTVSLGIRCRLQLRRVAQALIRP